MDRLQGREPVEDGGTNSGTESTDCRCNTGEETDPETLANDIPNIRCHCCGGGFAGGNWYTSALDMVRELVYAR